MNSTDVFPASAKVEEITIEHRCGQIKVLSGMVRQGASPEKDRILVHWPLYGILEFYRRGNPVLKAHIGWKVSEADCERLKRGV